MLEITAGYVATPPVGSIKAERFSEMNIDSSSRSISEIVIDGLRRIEGPILLMCPREDNINTWGGLSKRKSTGGKVNWKGPGVKRMSCSFKTKPSF